MRHTWAKALVIVAIAAWLLLPAAAIAAESSGQAAAGAGTLGDQDGDADQDSSISTVLAAILSGAAGAVIGGVFTLVATRRAGMSSRSLERHKFRYEIGRITAEKRLEAYIALASLACCAYRTRFSTDWETGEWKQSYHEFVNYFYDNRYFFSRSLGEAFGRLKESLSLDFPKRDIAEEHLNAFYEVVRDDLLLSDLEESARRAVEAAVEAPD